MSISASTKLCMIIGDPVEHSLSPAMHNAAYAALGIDDQFVFVATHVRPSQLEQAVAGARAMGIRGLTCTIPHKVTILNYLDELDEIAKTIGAVNTVVNTHGKLKGYNTDWLGIVTPLEQVTSLSGKRVALVGAGGAARAMAYGVTSRGASLTVFNRSIDRAADLQRDFSATIRPFEAIREVTEYDIILNATPLGMGEYRNDTPVPKDSIRKGQIVFEAVYAPRETRLVQEAKLQGATVIYGSSMLLYQGTAQFTLYTGREAPIEIMRSVIEPL